MSGSELKLVIVPSPIGLVIGNLNHLIEEKISVNKPYILMMTPTKEGAQVSLQPIIGMPSVLILDGKCWWEVEDQNLKHHYLEIATGLSLVGTMPKNITDIKKRMN